MEYIHYGHTHFDESLFNKIENKPFVKPRGGLWASSIDAEYGWKDWCKSEEFGECKDECSFKFKLSDNANVLHLRSVDDLRGLPRNKSLVGFDSINKYWLDFESILASGVDAIEIHISEDNSEWENSLYYALYGWDCDSILIMNKNIVEVIE